MIYVCIYAFIYIDNGSIDKLGAPEILVRVGANASTIPHRMRGLGDSAGCLRREDAEGCRRVRDDTPVC